MACIIKSTPGKGVVSFTTPERDRVIFKNKELQNKIYGLKDKWIIGLHHNWHDHNFVKHPLFDFSMAGAGDLRGQSTPLVELDACNFVPECFQITPGEKFWDVLYVARTVPFKRIPVFFKSAKRLLDTGNDYRILLIAPVESSAANDFFSSYDKMFSRGEKDKFSLIAPQHDYPFPYDTTTLAFFYRHAKVFAHYANDERRCRTAAYAWACGMPVVSQSDPASILPKHLRKEPYFYHVPHDGAYESRIIKAISDYSQHNGDLRPPAEYFSVHNAVQRFKTTLTDMFGVDDQNYSTANLDIRLGRHHNLATGSNKIPMSLTQFVDILRDNQKLTRVISYPDPEMAICEM